MIQRASVRRETQYLLLGLFRAWDPQHQGPVQSGFQPPYPRRMRPGEVSPKPVTHLPRSSPPLSTSKPPCSCVGDPTVSMASRIRLLLFPRNETVAPSARGSVLEAFCCGRGTPSHSWLRDHVPCEPAQCRGCGALAFRRPETPPGGSTGSGLHWDRQWGPAGTDVVPVPRIVVSWSSCPVPPHQRPWTSNEVTETAVPLRWGGLGWESPRGTRGARSLPSCRPWRS